MTKKSVTINLENGLDARPIALLVQRASQHESRIYIEIGDKRVNAKSIMGMMSLVLDNGETLTVSADGADEKEAVVDLEQFLSGQTA
jgi:catabolite repression HPr-like protein